MIHSKKIGQAGVLASAAFLLFVAPAMAQRGGGGGGGRNNEPAPRTNPLFLKAFHDSTVEAAKSTVRVLCDDKEVALGTVVGSDGWILTKFSQLSGKTACKLKSGAKLDAKVIGVHRGVRFWALPAQGRGYRFTRSRICRQQNRPCRQLACIGWPGRAARGRWRHERCGENTSAGPK